MEGLKGLVSFTNEDNSEVYINPDRIEFITKDKYYGITAIYLQSGMRIKVKESLSEVIEKLGKYLKAVREKYISDISRTKADSFGMMPD